MSSAAENKNRAAAESGANEKTGEKMNATAEKIEAPVSEGAELQKQETEKVEQQGRHVPLEALEAERRRRQEVEAENRIKDEMLRKFQESQKQPEPEDNEEFVNRGELRKFHEKLTKEEMALMKREIAEETFKDTQPDAIRLINTHLKEILEKKPWLADSIASAPNRYARAYEVVNDYMPHVAPRRDKATEAAKIVENAQKPGSPVAAGKPQQLSGKDYLKSIAGTKEFREYRNKLLGR